MRGFSSAASPRGDSFPDGSGMQQHTDSAWQHADPVMAQQLLLLLESNPVPAAVDPASTSLRPSQVPSDGGGRVDPASRGVNSEAHIQAQ